MQLLLQVQKCYEISGMYSKINDDGEQEGAGDFRKLEQLGELLNTLDAGDSILVASSFSHLLNLANLAEEVQIAYRRRVKQEAKKGDIGDENSALTESDLEETFRRLVNQLGKSPVEIFHALKNQTVDLVLTAHPTQSVRRSLLQKHTRCVCVPMPPHSSFSLSLSHTHARTHAHAHAQTHTESKKKKKLVRNTLLQHSWQEAL